MAVDAKLSLYEQLLAQNARSPVFARVAEGYRALGDVQKAIDTCEAGVQANPRSVTGYLVLGRCYLERGVVDKAQQSFERALDLDRRSMPAMKMLGDIFVSQGMNKEGAQKYADILALDPLDASTQKLLARCRITEPAPAPVAAPDDTTIEVEPEDTQETPEPAAGTAETPAEAEPVPANEAPEAQQAPAPAAGKVEAPAEAKPVPAGKQAPEAQEPVMDDVFKKLAADTVILQGVFNNEKVEVTPEKTLHSLADEAAKNDETWSVLKETAVPQSNPKALASLKEPAAPAPKPAPGTGAGPAALVHPAENKVAQGTPAPGEEGENVEELPEEFFNLAAAFPESQEPDSPKVEPEKPTAGAGEKEYEPTAPGQTEKPAQAAATEDETEIEIEEQPQQNTGKKPAAATAGNQAPPLPPQPSPTVSEPGKSSDASQKPRIEVSKSVASSTLAEIFYRQGQVDQAIEVYRHLLAKEPLNGKIKARLEGLIGESRVMARTEAGKNVQKAGGVAADAQQNKPPQQQNNTPPPAENKPPS